MDFIKLELQKNGNGKLILRENEDIIGEMVVYISGKEMTVIHTEIDPSFEGRGYAKKLLDEMVSYARKKDLKVIALCPYVHAAFSRHPELYNDIWKK